MSRVTIVWLFFFYFSFVLSFEYVYPFCFGLVGEFNIGLSC